MVLHSEWTKVSPLSSRPCPEAPGHVTPTPGSCTATASAQVTVSSQHLESLTEQVFMPLHFFPSYSGIRVQIPEHWPYENSTTATVLQLKPHKCSRTQSKVTLQKLLGICQPKIYYSKSFPQHSFDPKTRPNIRDSCKPSRDVVIASSLSARHAGAVPRVSCTWLIQLTVSPYPEIELFISVYSWAGYEDHISKQDCFNWLCWSSQRSVKMGLR